MQTLSTVPGKTHKLPNDIEQFKTENFPRTKQHMVSRHGRQVWHARSPGLAEVPGDNTLWLYVAVRNKQGINCLGGLNEPPPTSYGLQTQPLRTPPPKLHLVPPGVTLQLQPNNNPTGRYI